MRASIGHIIPDDLPVSILLIKLPDQYDPRIAPSVCAAVRADTWSDLWKRAYPEELEAQGAACLNTAVAANDHHLNTGYIGTQFLLPVLCRYGYADTDMERIINDLMSYGSLQPEPVLGVTVIQVAEQVELIHLRLHSQSASKARFARGPEDRPMRPAR